MRALQIRAPGHAVVVDVPPPEPGPGEVLIRVDAVTTCPQWDLKIMEGNPMFPGRDPTYPYALGQPGHEAAGVVEAVGDGVTTLAPGARVATWRDGGHHRPGCYAEYVVRGDWEVLEVPADLPATRVTSLELAMCLRVSFHPLEALGVMDGARFGVSGLGAAGLIALQMARAAGAREVIGFDLSPERRQAAVDLGAEAAFDPRDAPQVDRVSADALDAAIDCAGVASSVQFLMDRTRHAVALFGLLRDDVAFGWDHWRGLALIGYPFTRDGAVGHSRVHAEQALRQIVDGSIDLSVLVSAELPLTDYTEGIDLLRRQEAIKVCFRP